MHFQSTCPPNPPQKICIKYNHCSSFILPIQLPRVRSLVHFLQWYFLCAWKRHKLWYGLKNYLWDWTGVTVGTGFKASLKPLICQAFHTDGPGILVPACWPSPRRLVLLPSANYPNTKPPFVYSSSQVRRHFFFFPEADGQAQETQPRCETVGLAAGSWQPGSGRSHTLFLALPRHSWVCHKTTLNLLDMHFFTWHDWEVNGQVPEATEHWTNI